MRIAVLSIVHVLSICTFTLGQHTYEYSEPEMLTDGWPTNNLRSLNIDTTNIYRLFEELQNQEHEIHSILVLKNSEMIIEEYFGENSANTQHDLRSATKSITSILMGIAIDKGIIESVDDPISKYVKGLAPKKNRDERKAKITIRHLLTMSTGLDCNDWDKKSKGQEDRVFKSTDWLQTFLDLPMINEPGTVASYCTMGQVFAAEIISQASGMTLDEFAQSHLFDPLNITNVSWGHTSKKEVLPSARRLYMTSRDMAKIGQLLLDRGKWNGIPIVSEAWIDESTTEKTKITGIDYGFLWWEIPFKVNENVIQSIVATGNGGQYITVFPDLDIVAVFTGGAYNSQDDKLPFAIMTNVMLPALMAEN
ncbi:MAG: serine hydrolase [Cyclobacteriaceae bacterium]